MDNATKTLIRYEWKAFIRNRYQLVMLGVMFLFGLYAIYAGQTEINAQRQTIAALATLEQEEFATYKASFLDTLATPEEERNHDIASRPSFAWYRHGYHAVLPPHDYAALAIGQRDLYRYYYRLTGTSLHYQLFENELANPANLMAGNFDLSFLLTYLFPLLIIAFCYGLYAFDEESGRLPLLKIQRVSIRKIILVRLAFYFAVVTGLALLIVGLGLIVAGNPLKAANQWPALAWLAGTAVYCAFWFGLLLLIVGFRKGSSFNAMTAVACWLLFLIIVPGVLNVIATTKYPLNSATLAGLTRRTGLENEEDEAEAKAVIQEFLAHHPELTGSDSLLDNSMMPKAYAAFTSLKDHHNQGKIDEYTRQVNRRMAWTARFYWLSPAVATQEAFSTASQTNANTFLRFQNDLVDFHREITDFYFSRLFRDIPLALADYSNLPVFTSTEYFRQRKVVLWVLARVLIATGLVFGTGVFILKNR